MGCDGRGTQPGHPSRDYLYFGSLSYTLMRFSRSDCVVSSLPPLLSSSQGRFLARATWAVAQGRTVGGHGSSIELQGHEPATPSQLQREHLRSSSDWGRHHTTVKDLLLLRLQMCHALCRLAGLAGFGFLLSAFGFTLYLSLPDESLTPPLKGVTFSHALLHFVMIMVSKGSADKLITETPECPSVISWLPAMVPKHVCVYTTGNSVGLCKHEFRKKHVLKMNG